MSFRRGSIVLRFVAGYLAAVLSRAGAMPAGPAVNGPGTTGDVGVEDLAWLAGGWKGKVGENDYETVYTPATGGVILGASKELKDGRVVVFDFERIAAVKGKVTLTPWPFGKKSVSFPLASYDAKARTAVFENLEHDFPQTFAYRLTARDRLQIRLTGTMRGQARTCTIELTRRKVSAADPGSRAAR